MGDNPHAIARTCVHTCVPCARRYCSYAVYPESSATFDGGNLQFARGFNVIVCGKVFPPGTGTVSIPCQLLPCTRPLSQREEDKKHQLHLLVSDSENVEIRRVK